MIFLKRIETIGFKSFAEHTIVNFDSSLVGIVGPNGSGKSNINDAVRWAFGEQSNKSLRSDNNYDIVFAGSQDHAPLNYAEVNLIFDNSNRSFSSLEYNEVSIKRTYKKDTNESAYYINNQRVRLKDVIDIALETGITKSSLAIISQGSVSRFVESKPEDRRLFFDEAAGVAKYKKRKDESIKNLAKIKTNYDRLNDILNEKEKKLPILKRQSERAIVFKENYDKLKNMELTRIVNQIDVFKKRIEILNSEYIKNNNELEKLKENFNVKNKDIAFLESNIRKNDGSITRLTNDINKITSSSSECQIKINTLKLRKKSDINFSEAKKNQVTSISDFKECKLSIKSYEKEISSLDKKISILFEKSESLKNVKNKVDNELKNLDREISRIDARIAIIEESLLKRTHLFSGVRTVIENKNILTGIVGIVSDILFVDKEYEAAIDELLKNAKQNIVVNKTDDAKTAISFLRKNKSGYATFLPLDNLKANLTSDDVRFVLQSTDGFIGFANELVKIEKKYRCVADNLLSNAIIVRDFDSAVALSKINNRLHIVTLTGDHILPYGAINGGSKKNALQNNVSQNEITILEKRKQIFIDNKEQLLSKSNDSEQIINEANIKLSSYKSTRAIIVANINNETFKMNTAANNFLAFTGNDIEEFIESGKTTNDENELIILNDELKKFASKKIVIQEQVNMYIGFKNADSEKLSELRNEISELNEKKQIAISTSMNIKGQIERINQSIQNDNEFLSRNYQMTFDSASLYLSELLEKVIVDDEYLSQMRSEISKMGSVDFESIAIYEEEKSEYEKILSELEDIHQAVKNIEKIIIDLDDEMVDQFTKTFKEINNVFPEVFANFFGSGKAQLIFTNPDDVINSGIDILIAPPGKKITNLNLLSGGEKSLVALAVLFSILKVRPIPLVILDEVEAPLDIVNVERFAKYIKKFSDTTQFIVVTHRQGTMENCDTLYGATMQKPGSTSIVRINLVEARKHSNEEV